jgi:hypothetical protein
MQRDVCYDHVVEVGMSERRCPGVAITRPDPQRISARRGVTGYLADVSTHPFHRYNNDYANVNSMLEKGSPSCD